MRIGFIDTSGWDFNVDTPYQRPLGGSHSAACYLAAALAAGGHDVSFVTGTTAPGVIRGVTCLSTHSFQPAALAELNLDACIVLASATAGLKVRDHLAPGTALLLWTQHAHDQPAVARLAEPPIGGMYDGIVLVSEWQRQQFIATFRLPGQRVRVLRNAPAPPFAELFPPGTPVLQAKSQPPVLAYTSTPFRGLDVLLRTFPVVRQSAPGVRLKVFSDMSPYMTPRNEDEREHGDLYRLARQTEGVEYLGSVAQPQLAREMAQVSVLAYPNTFAETSCIAVMEALAAGCRIVTSDLAALPETTAGFARLVPVDQGPAEFERRFIEETLLALEDLRRADAEPQLRRQVDAVQQHGTWAARAREWSAYLEDLVRQPRVTAPPAAAEARFSPAPMPRNQQPLDPYFGPFISLLRRSIGAGGSEFGLGMMLFSLAVSIRAERMIEIGRFRGFSTLALASALRLIDAGWDEPQQHKQRPEINYADFEAPKERRLFSVDPYPAAEADALLAEADVDNYVMKLDRPSDDVKFQGEVDLIFIDGEHTYEGVVADIQRLVPENLRIGGYFILHDYYGWYDAAGNNNSPIKQVCDDLVDEGLVEHLLIDTGYQSFMIFRKLSVLDESAGNAAEATGG